jgi:AcrR family transcriptional regulator
LKSQSPAAETPLRRRGRPRSEQAHRAILDATAHLLAENGYAALTIEKVAERAGVARQTIYRRWPSKLKLVAELLHEVSEAAPLPDTGHIRTDLIALYRRYVENVPTPGGPIIPPLIAESLYNEELAAILSSYIMARRDQAIALFQKAIARGEIRSDCKADILVDLLSGFSWYRKLITGIPLRKEDDEIIVDTFLRGIEP